MPLDWERCFHIIAYRFFGFWMIGPSFLENLYFHTCFQIWNDLVFFVHYFWVLKAIAFCYAFPVFCYAFPMGMARGKCTTSKSHLLCRPVVPPATGHRGTGNSKNSIWQLQIGIIHIYHKNVYIHIYMYIFIYYIYTCMCIYIYTESYFQYYCQDVVFFLRPLRVKFDIRPWIGSAVFILLHIDFLDFG